MINHTFIMKLNQLVLSFLLAGLFSCQNSKDKIVINGEIIGGTPVKVEYTLPIHGICNWYFKESVLPDSLGKFQIEVESDKAIFVKLRTSSDKQGTLIAEPGKTYDVLFDLASKEKTFSVTDKSALAQETFNKFPNPEHIQLGAREFLRDTVTSKMKETISQRRTSEIAEFEKLLADKSISRDVFDLVKADRNCYYDALMATIAWIKDYITIQGRENVFTREFEDLWKETFKQPLISDNEIVRSSWFNFYAETYIYFMQYMNGDFTKEKWKEMNKTIWVHDAKEYLPSEIREDYIANYLYDGSIQKEYEKELVKLFDDFKSDYPESKYIPYISPLIDEIIDFHKASDSDFSENVKFVENYQNLNTLADIARSLPNGIIYVDVWATWCGPCKEEFKHKEELKKLLQEKNIQNLYISVDYDRDTVQWKNMIKFYNLEGYHVRANKELETELRRIFDKGPLAIPWYLLIKNDGNILKKYAYPPSAINVLEKEINEI